MPHGDARLGLASGRLTGVVLPDEGGVLAHLEVDGRPVLTRTPWAEAVVPSSHPAPDEDTWVRRWRGGWQVCLPSAGQPDPADARQGFHGAASQAPWRVLSATHASVRLAWADGDGLAAEREWLFDGDEVVAITSLVNRGGSTRRVAVAEHLVLGGQVLAGPLTLATDARGLQSLDYAGLPAGDEQPWPGEDDDRWTHVDARTPARVGGLVRATKATVSGPHVSAVVSWHGLPHALVWEELGISTDPPWDGSVRALGLEPSSVPHGAGTAAPDATRLEPGQTLGWRTALAVSWPSEAAA